jgi:hypothetical protein
MQSALDGIGSDKQAETTFFYLFTCITGDNQAQKK